MKIKFKPWMSLVIVAVLFGAVSEMDYRDQVRTEDAKVAYRMPNTFAGRF